jgi:Zn-dependent protease
MDPLLKIVIYAVPVIIAITLHEAAHGFVARYFGDDTAANAGRVTLNPLKHIDLFGTILLPAFLLLSKAGFVFGYAKPVPVNFAALRDPKRDMIWVAAAGPGMNILLAMISAGLLGLVSHFGSAPQWLLLMLWTSVEINLVLAVLNLWPIPPLDGSKVAVGLLPGALALPLWRLSRFGLVFVIVIFFFAPLIGVDVFGWMIGRPVAFLERPILVMLHQLPSRS